MIDSPKTIFCDIDGTLLTFVPTLEEMETNAHIDPLPGAAEKTKQWYKEGHLIILTTARPESVRSITQRQLANAGIFYHHIVFNLTNGPRVVINDILEYDPPKALAFNVIRNKDGIKDIP
jgi:FMN phosphatase YigB (HAD superfamily)